MNKEELIKKTVKQISKRIGKKGHDYIYKQAGQNIFSDDVLHRTVVNDYNSFVEDTIVYENYQPMDEDDEVDCVINCMHDCQYINNIVQKIKCKDITIFDFAIL